MAIGIEDVEQDCLECGKKCNGRRSLGNHVARSHPDMGGLKGYLHKFLLKEPVVCLCGCGEKTTWKEARYRYNDYVTGHNKSGFRVKQPTFTQEQIASRNDAIRESYRNRREEITKKISESVTKGLANSKFDFSKMHLERWKDSAYKTKQHDSRMKSWQGAEGRTRRKKVFTAEFGKKISDANMRRDAQNTSKAEKQFYTSLKQVFPDAEPGKWFNFTERNVCVDVWLPNEKFVIEFDGVYWHGLDREENFTINQLISMTNDVVKDFLFQDRKISFLRIKEGLDLSNVKSIDDLESLAHFITKNGEIVKDDRHKITDDTIIVSRESLLRADKEWIEARLLPTLKHFLMAHVATNGWFYPPFDGTLSEALRDLRSSSQGRNASLWLKSFVRSFWDVDEGPMKSFDDERALESVLRYRLGLNNSKPYTYTMSSGESITTNETFNITLGEIRRGFVVQRKSVSWFKPQTAYDIYKQHINVTNPTVWDPSIGFSARLLGFAAAFPKGTYIGTDPASLMFEDATFLKSELEKECPELSIDLRNQGSEFVDLSPNSLDLVFTSPPYFNKEKYVNERGQCWKDYPVFDDWLSNYLMMTYERALAALKPGSKMIINFDDQCADDSVFIAKTVGFIHESSSFLAVRRDHFGKKTSGKSSDRHERIDVFVKP